MEQDAGGFNLANENFTGAWAAYFGETPIIRGNYMIDHKGNYHLDMATKVVATKKYLKIWIQARARSGTGSATGRIPVTAADYIYTWQQFVKPGNNVASTTGYDKITSAKAGGHGKIVTFNWKQAVRRLQDLFGYIYPSYALKGQNWNTLWADCVCGNRTASRSRTARTTSSSWTPGAGSDPQGQHQVVRQEAGRQGRSSASSTPTRPPRSTP